MSRIEIRGVEWRGKERGEKGKYGWRREPDIQRSGTGMGMMCSSYNRLSYKWSECRVNVNIVRLGRGASQIVTVLNAKLKSLSLA